MSEASAPSSPGDFAAAMERLVGRPVAEDAIGFLSLATHLGAATAAAKGLTTPPPGPAHWDSLLAALMIAELPSCRWLRIALLDGSGSSPAALEQQGILPPRPVRRDALRAAAAGPAPPGTAGWLTASAAAQVQMAGRLAADSVPLAAEHLAASLLATPASGHALPLPPQSGADPGRTPASVAAAWMADRRDRFSPSAVPGGFDAALDRSALADPLVGAMLGRMKAGAADPRALPIPFLAAVTEAVAHPMSATDARLAAELHPFVSLDRAQTWPEDRGMRTLVRRAQALAARLGETALTPRHVLGAAIAPDQPDLPPLAVPLPDPDTGAPPAEAWATLRTRFLSHLADEETDPRRLETWTDLVLSGRVARIRVASDAPGGRDLLEFERHARAIAAVIADREVAPPLAVALFGPWGSGKSTMIALIKAALREIEERAARGRRSEFCRGIVLVDFNAWHYAESSLWASLFVRILEALALHLRHDTGDKVAAERAALLLELEEAKQQEQSARAAAAEERRVAAAAGGGTVGGAAQAEPSRAVLGADADGVARVLLKTDPAALAEAAGAAELLAQARALRETQKRLAGVGGRVGRIWGALDRAERVRLLPGIVAAGGAVAMIALFAATYGLAWLGTVLAPLSAAWVWLQPRWKALDRALDGASAYLDALEQAAAAAEAAGTPAPAAEPAAAEAALRRAEDFDRTAAAAARRAAELEARIASIAPARLLESFVGDRAASADYAKHLGLPTLIRRDLEGLSAHLKALRAQQDPPAARPVERIVLFIDDLDRCRPEVVVRVLEAVHILLTFDLFEVVVGVDVRWVERALERHHEGQFGAGGPLDATEYLEKIFQVPFWVPRMGDGGRAAVLEAALPAPVAPSGTGLPGGSGAPPAVPRRIGPPEVTLTGEPETRAPVAPLPPLDPVALLPEERAALLRWGKLAGDTPRRLKRFARSYLIFRASLSVPERDRFVDDRAWDAAAFLLAMGCRFPDHWAAIAAGVTVDRDRDITLHASWQDVPILNDDAQGIGRELRGVFGLAENWPDIALCTAWLNDIARFGFGRAA